MEQMASIDFFVVPTATFRVLFVFVVLSHARRRVLHFQVTDHPSQEWTMQQVREAFPSDHGADTFCATATPSMAVIWSP
jgi:putative transposase